jgi:hypothetical protein
MKLIALLSFAIVGVMSSESDIYPYMSVQQTPGWSIDYSESLSCGACVLGKYNYCQQGNVRKCCKPDDKVCNQGLTCTADNDLFNSLYKICEASNRPKSCGPPKVYHITSVNGTITAPVNITIDKMGVTDSCTYKVFSTCTFPEIVTDSEDVMINIASFKGKPNDKDQDDKIEDSKFTWFGGKNGSVAKPPADQ